MKNEQTDRETLQTAIEMHGRIFSEELEKKMSEVLSTNPNAKHRGEFEEIGQLYLKQLSTFHY